MCLGPASLAPAMGGFLLAETSGQARAWGGGLGTVFSCGVVGSFVFQDGFCAGKELGAGPELPTCWLGAARWLSWPHPQDSWPCLLFGALVTLVSAHSGIGSSLWWFSGTPDNSPKTSSFPTAKTEPPVDKGPPGWRSAEDRPSLWRAA